MPESTPPSLSEIVHQRLVKWLDDAAWPPDTQLPGEHELARRFAVSRPVLRQALAQLRAEGRIHVRKGAGSFTRAQPDAVPTLHFDALGSIADVRRFLEFRCALEGEIAACAASRSTAADHAVIRRAQTRLDQALQNGEVAIEDDLVLHALFARITDNRFYVATLAALAEQTRFSIRLTRELTTRPVATRLADIQREHARICDALIEGDALAARSAMNAHLQGGIERLFG
jgi:GntR family transcriptional repressor for pyruvate dehydrogenase complex